MRVISDAISEGATQGVCVSNMIAYAVYRSNATGKVKFTSADKHWGCTYKKTCLKQYSPESFDPREEVGDIEINNL